MRAGHMYDAYKIWEGYMKNLFLINKLNLINLFNWFLINF